MDKRNKTTLLSLRQNTDISTQQLAEEAGVSLTEAYIVEIGGFVDEEIAYRVITAFSRLSGIHYTINDIRLQNIPPPTSSETRSSSLPIMEQRPPRQNT